jgi:hypothetical protein
MAQIVSYVHLWREETGGGRPVDYLKWLAKSWEAYKTSRIDAGEGTWLAFDMWMLLRKNRK